MTDEIARAIAPEFDSEYYLASFAPGLEPSDPLAHYLAIGWKQGRDPCGWFSTRHYLAAHPDVHEKDINPFYHYIIYGRKERRHPKPKMGPVAELLAQKNFATAPGPLFEPFTEIPRAPDVKAIAYYLPQFHRCAENDVFWGNGFTEWRNVARAAPRFSGHIQPRLPLDFGFYDLIESDIYRQQIDLARRAGIHGFCFYHYAFGERRVLNAPMERILADTSLDFPFLLMWANESWTRNWDGAGGQILIEQRYSESEIPKLAADFVRHFEDRRYIHISGRPLLMIYNAASIPNAMCFIEKLRAALKALGGTHPLIYMAQTFSSSNPGDFGCDGAIEFPPHNLNDAAVMRQELHLFDEGFKAGVLDYEEAAALMNSRSMVDYPLIRCCAPNWDNTPRRPGQGLLLHNSTPRKFEKWVHGCAEYARKNPIADGQNFIAINAWNEWAEGAYLEPDVHYGHAYLNALGRGLLRGLKK